MRWALRRRRLRSSGGRNTSMRGAWLLVGEDIGEAGKDRLRGEGERLRTLLDGVQHVQDLRVAETLQLAHGAAKDLGDGLFAFRFV